MRCRGGAAGGRGRARPALAALASLTLQLSTTSTSLPAQTLPASRAWRAPERVLITDLSGVTAVAASRMVVYAATRNGLAIYDRGQRRWTETVGALDGFPAGLITAMAADPNDDTAWLGGQAQWLRYDPFLRRVESGPLPGTADQVVLDARDPSRGAFFHTAVGWYVVGRGSLAAMPTRDVPAPASRTGSLTMADLRQRMPAFDAVRLRLERDDQLRTWRLTSAAAAPLTNELFVGTDGNGVFRLDPLGYGTERLSAGVVGAATSALAAWRSQVCAASDERIASPRHGITCFDDQLGDFRYVESAGLAALPAGAVHAVLVTERAVWTATDQGVLRSPRHGGRLTQLRLRDGLPSDRALALAAAPTGVWAATSGGVALVADTGRGVVVVADAVGPPVLALAPTAGDTLWAGTAAGVVGFVLPLGGVVIQPDGPGPLREPVVALASRGDSIVAATASRFVIRGGGTWRVVETPGAPLGGITRVVADERAGYWVAGPAGFAWFEPSRMQWTAWLSPGDVPLPVRDIAATRDHVWVATDAGVVRYERRVLVP